VVAHVEQQQQQKLSLLMKTQRPVQDQPYPLFVRVEPQPQWAVQSVVAQQEEPGVVVLVHGLMQQMYLQQPIQQVRERVVVLP
jgi:alpha-beta hydrolase superfamily lysophospholipase